MSALRSSGMWSPLAIKQFRGLWIARVVSLMGSGMQVFAVGVFLVSSSGTSFTIALAEVASSAPYLLTLLLAGKLADRFDREKLLLGLYSIMTVASGILWYLFYREQLISSTLLFFLFTLSFISAMSVPAWHSHLSLLVPAHHLQRANALGTLAFNVGRSVGPLLGVLVAGWLALHYIFLFNCLSYAVVGAVLFFQIRRRALVTAQQFNNLSASRVSYWNMLQGPGVFILLISLFWLFFSGFTVMSLIPYLNSVKGGDDKTLALLMAALGGGTLMGSLCVNVVTNRFGVPYVLLMAATCVACGTSAMTFAGLDALSLLALGLVGIGWSVMLPITQAQTQERFPALDRGRATALFFLMFYSALSSGALVAGLLPILIGWSATLQISSFIVFASGLLLTGLVKKKFSD